MSIDSINSLVTMTTRLSHQRDNKSGNSNTVERATMLKRVQRERRQRVLLLQRLNVLEKRSFEKRQNLHNTFNDISFSPPIPEDNEAVSSNTNKVFDKFALLQMAHIAGVVCQEGISLRDNCATIWHMKERIAQWLLSARADQLHTLRTALADIDGETHEDKKCVTLKKMESKQSSQGGQRDLKPLLWSLPSEGPVVSDSDTSTTLEPVSVQVVLDYVEMSAIYQQRIKTLEPERRMVFTDIIAIANYGFPLTSEQVSDCNFDEPDNTENIVWTSEAKNLIKAATMPKLIEKLTDDTFQDLNFRFIFILTYPMFSTADEIVNLLFKRHDVSYPPNTTPGEIELFKQKRMAPIQIKVLGTLKYWLQEYFEDFSEDEQLCELLQKQILYTLENAEKWSIASAKNITDLINKKQKEISVPIDSPKSEEHKSKALSIFNLDDHKSKRTAFDSTSAEEIAIAICLQDFKMFAKIKPREFIDQTWSRHPEQAPNITGMIDRFNGLTSFVQVTILTQNTVSKRAAMFKKITKIAAKCLELNNFNAVFGIYCALNANAVYRLKQTWEALGTRTKQRVDTLKALFSTESNRKAFRNALNNALPPCIPHLGLFLSDLTFIDDGNDDMDRHMINFMKMSMLAERISSIRQWQLHAYSGLNANPHIIEMMDRNMKHIFDDEVLWQLSQKAETKKKP